MDEATLDLWLAGMGITPAHPNYAALKAALRSQASTLTSLQGRQQAEDTRRWDITSDQAQQRIDREYQIAIRSAENQEEINEINRWKARKDYEIDQARVAVEQGRLGLDTELGRGRLNLDTELGRGDLALRQGAQGLDLLRTDVELRSTPRSWAKLADWEAGIAANPNAPGFLQALLSNAGASAGGSAPGMVQKVGVPETNSLQSVLASMGVGQAASDQTNAAMSTATSSATAPKQDPSAQQVAIQAITKNWQPSNVEGWDPKDVAALKSIAALAGIGEQRYANKFSQLDTDDQDILLGGMARLGRSPDRVLRNIDRYRVGNTGSGISA